MNNLDTAWIVITGKRYASYQISPMDLPLVVTLLTEKIFSILFAVSNEPKTLVWRHRYAEKARKTGPA